MYQSALSDTEFLIRHVLRRPRAFAAQDGDLIGSVLPEMARFAERVLEPLGRRIDAAGCTVVDGRVRMPEGFAAAYRQFADDGWVGLSLPEAYGGSALSNLAQAAVSEMVNGACLPFGMLALTSRSSARTVIEHGEPWLRDLLVPKLCAGQATGTIVMTEPGAGSDVSLLQTRATPREGRRYGIAGNKIFISCGDHDLTDQIVHLVLAKTTGQDDAISLFAVPRVPISESGGTQSRIKTLRIEKKLGIHGSPTCALAFEDAEGFLIGEPGRGLRAIFTMVNEMRLEVAVEGVGIASAATEGAWRYAAERIQGRDSSGQFVTIDRHPDVRRMLLTMRSLTEGARALVLQTAAHADDAAGAGDQRERAAALLTFLLPVCKATVSDIAVETANIGIQVHGGSGYTRDYRAEQHLRDARILPIYEGTNGIQAVDLVMRKLRRGSPGYTHLCEDIATTLAETADDADLRPIHAAVASAFEKLKQSTTAMLGYDEDNALAAASAYLALLGLVSIGWMWLRMAAASRQAPAQRTQKLILARFFADQRLSGAGQLSEQVAAGARSTPHLDAFSR